MTTNVREFDDRSWDDEVLKSGEVVLVDFWAPWCAPCRAIAPSVEQLASAYQGKAKVGKLNIDDNRAVTERYHVRSIPTLIVFKNGQPVGQLVGAASKSRIEEMLRRACETS